MQNDPPSVAERSDRSGRGQSKEVEEQNGSYFSTGPYRDHVDTFATYALVRQAISDELGETGSVVDIGNGGVFQYDPRLAERIVAVDPCFAVDEMAFDDLPQNVTAIPGSASSLPLEDESFDTAVLAFLFHHLVGENLGAQREAIRGALSEARRVLKPGGRVLIPESIVSRWFFPIERAMFPALKLVCRTPLLGGHPPVLQLPMSTVRDLVEEQFELSNHYELPCGRWNSVFSYKWPSALTPSSHWIFIGLKAKGE